MEQHYQQGEMEIDLISMCLYVLKQWRKLLLFLLVGVLIGCGVSFYKMKVMAPENIGSYLESLKPEDIDEDKVRQYADYQALYDTTLERDDHSVALNMDPNEVYSAQTKYFVTAGYENLNEVAESFNSLLYQGENLNTILGASGLDCTPNDILELVNIEFGKINLDNQILGENTVIDVRNGNLTVSVMAPNEDCLNKMLDAVKSAIDTAVEEFSASFADFKCTELSNQTYFGYNAQIAASQADYLKSRQTILKELTDQKGKLSDDEELYYAYHYDEEAFNKVESGFSKKWPVILAVVLAFVGAVWYAVEYIADKHVKNEAELEKTFDVSVIGSMDDSKFKNPIDRLLDRWEKAGLAPANSTEYAVSVLNSIKADSIALVFDANDEPSAVLAKALAADDSRIKLAGNLACDKDALTIVSGCSGMVLISHMNAMSKSELAKILETGKRLEATNYGAIVIR